MGDSGSVDAKRGIVIEYHAKMYSFSPKMHAALISLTLIFILLVNAVIYACSNPHFMETVFNHSSMDQETKETPCAEPKEDICQAVRDRMVTVQPVSSQDAQGVLVPILLPPVDIPEHLALPTVSQLWQVIYHAVFKLSLPVSLRVLRI